MDWRADVCVSVPLSYRHHDRRYPLHPAAEPTRPREPLNPGSHDEAYHHFHRNWLCDGYLGRLGCLHLSRRSFQVRFIICVGESI